MDALSPDQAYVSVDAKRFTDLDKTKLGNCGLDLGSIQFSLLPQLPQK